MERGFAGRAGRWAARKNGYCGLRRLWRTSEDARNLVGEKGLNLSMCAKAGLPVPPGFFISTEALAACNMPVSSSRICPVH